MLNDKKLNDHIKKKFPTIETRKIPATSTDLNMMSSAS